MNNRITQLRSLLQSRNIEAILVIHLPHVRYLTGFSGSAGSLFVSAKKAVFFTDFRYQDQVAEEVDKDVTAIIDRAPIERLVSDGLVSPGMSLGFQESYMTVGAFEAIKKKFKKVTLEKTGDLLNRLTMVKTEDEIGSIRKAANIAAKVYKDILAIARPGVRENEIAMEISYLGRKYGAEKDAFDIIVASGPRGALPHGRASTKKIRKGEMVTLDFGFAYNGLHSDMTRTFSVGQPTAEARKIFDIVLRAEQAGVKAASAGMNCKELDAVCRDIIAAEGFGEEFGHSTGHGLGIEVHETPGVSTKGEEYILEENMVVTIEPGIYLPGKCGVRIEDDVVIGKNGARSLTTAPRELIIV